MSAQDDGHLMSNDDRLIYMANQIARNLASEGDAAAALTAQHIRDFWDGHMRARILALTAERPEVLTPIAAEAVASLR